jgi:tetratricopeptide (TPR) repeat protein
MLDVPNLFALLELVQQEGDAEKTIDLAISLYQLLQFAGKPRLLERVGQVRDDTSAAMGNVWNHAQFLATGTRIEQHLASGRLREALEGAQILIQRSTEAGEQAYPGADRDAAMAHLTLASVLKESGNSEQALPLLDEARLRFETIGDERMASVCVGELGECLDRLKRFDKAATAYEERIRRGEQLGDYRGVAVAKANLGTTRLNQGRLVEALAAYEEARQRFMPMDEPKSVSTLWHQTGMVYSSMGQAEAAEDAYRKSLGIDVRLGHVAGQARTLTQLGNLYNKVLDRIEESISFYRQAADKYSDIRDAASEAQARSGLAIALLRLGRTDEARKEIQHSIKCAESFGNATEPWKFWAIYSIIEMAAGNRAAAMETKRKGIAYYLDYRRDGGENHNPIGRLSLAVTQSLLANDAVTAASFLQQLAEGPNATGSLVSYVRALQAIVAGSRDRSIADDPDLDFGMAAEILFLIETLENHNLHGN